MEQTGNEARARRSIRSALLRSAASLLAVFLVWIAASFVHELAHGLTAAALGGKVLVVCCVAGDRGLAAPRTGL